jgi:hypothetical protein
MKIDDPMIVDLRAKVRAAQEEFDKAMAFHEAWKLAAYDKNLHERVGHSYAANTFLVIRQALRREMLLALMRLWDNASRAVGMRSVSKALGNRRVVDALAADCEAQWGQLQSTELENIPVEDRPAVAAALRRSEVAFGRRQSAKLRKWATDATDTISSYGDGGANHGTLKQLKILRDQYLAHRQVTPTANVGGADATDEKIEAFYQDMAKLIRLLMLSARNTDYDPQATAKLYRKNAVLFWAGVRGERTEGHPDYRPPRRPPVSRM